MAVCFQFQSPLKPINFPVSTPRKVPLLRCKASFSTTSTTEIEPVFTSVKSFAPATVANLGPGFDFLGAAVDGLGDYVSLSIDSSVTPVTGLGSSAASAAAAAVAVNELFGAKLGVDQLVLAGLESEAKVSGYHADNIAPAVMGGFVLIKSYDPLELKPLIFPQNQELFFILVSPEFEAPTKKMRAALPAEVGMPHHVWNCSQAGALVASVLEGDVVGLGKALSSDKIVEPKRAPLIPGMEDVKKAAIKGGAFGCTISGAGPTAVAVIDNEEKGKKIGQKMVEAFLEEGNLRSVAMVKRLDRVGARLIESVPR
ncbi:Homoserine kinase [Hibiscus syriacus]|uniref:Homoserine kinase n=1 Tax=Hibiscus syriacus TaxID=106335 RepID=A0A6A2Y8N4_HIBSY|nr:Homoserine kinase [Hibiscus syriacus]